MLRNKKKYASQLGGKKPMKTVLEMTKKKKKGDYQTKTFKTAYIIMYKYSNKHTNMTTRWKRFYKAKCNLKR